MTPNRPHLVLIAGPNGAGKSTAAPMLLRDTLGVDEFVNADAIASGISSFQPETAAIQAGRVMLRRISECTIMKEALKKDIDKLFSERTEIDRALARAIREALLQHKRAGNPVATWLDGKVVWVQAQDLEIQ